jgi:hypothetical protein
VALEGWGWDTGLAVWGTGCLVHIAGFHSWAVKSEERLSHLIAKLFTQIPGLGSAALLGPGCLLPTKQPPHP